MAKPVNPSSSGLSSEELSQEENFHKAEGEKDTTHMPQSEQNTQDPSLYSEHYSAEDIRREKPKIEKRLKVEEKRDPNYNDQT